MIYSLWECQKVIQIWEDIIEEKTLTVLTFVSRTSNNWSPISKLKTKKSIKIKKGEVISILIKKLMFLLLLLKLRQP